MKGRNQHDKNGQQNTKEIHHDHRTVKIGNREELKKELPIWSTYEVKETVNIREKKKV